MDVLIGTGDRDAFQLVGEHVTRALPARGVSELTRFTPEEVQAKYGLTPAQYPDFAALRGDPSDNLPGIPGVGEKTAAKWVREFGSLTALVERVDEVKGKAGDALRAHLASVLRNRQLTELVRDVPLPIGPPDLAARPVGPRRGAQALRQPAVPGAARAAVRDADQRSSPEAEERLRRRRRRCSGPDEVAGLAGRARRATAAGSGCACAAPGAAAPAACRARARRRAAARRRRRVRRRGRAHRGRRAGAGRLAGRPGRAEGAARRQGPAAGARRARLGRSPGVTCDTALAAYLALPGQRTFDLADLVAALPAARAARRGRARRPASSPSTAARRRPTPRAPRRRRCGPARSLDLADALDDELDRRGGDRRCCTDVELPLIGVLGRHGAHRHRRRRRPPGRRSSPSSRASVQARRAEEAYASVGREFNLGSPKQLQEILFDELSLPKTKRIKTGYTTDADALVWLSEQHRHPLLGAPAAPPRRVPAARPWSTR